MRLRNRTANQEFITKLTMTWFPIWCPLVLKQPVSTAKGKTLSGFEQSGPSTTRSAEEDAEKGGGKSKPERAEGAETLRGWRHQAAVVARDFRGSTPGISLLVTELTEGSH